MSKGSDKKRAEYALVRKPEHRNITTTPGQWTTVIPVITANVGNKILGCRVNNTGGTAIQVNLGDGTYNGYTIAAGADRAFDDIQIDRLRIYSTAAVAVQCILYLEP